MNLRYIPKEIAHKVRRLKFKSTAMENAIEKRQVIELQRLLINYSTMLKKKYINEISIKDKHIECKLIKKAIDALVELEDELYLYELFIGYVFKVIPPNEDAVIISAITNFENLDLAYDNILQILSKTYSYYEILYVGECVDTDLTNFNFNEIYDYEKGNIIVVSHKAPILIPIT